MPRGRGRGQSSFPQGRDLSGRIQKGKHVQKPVNINMGFTRASTPPPGLEGVDQNGGITTCDPLISQFLVNAALANAAETVMKVNGRHQPQQRFGRHVEDEENNPNYQKIGQPSVLGHNNNDAQHENREQGLRKAMMEATMKVFRMPVVSPAPTPVPSNRERYNGVGFRMSSFFDGSSRTNKNAFEVDSGGMTSSGEESETDPIPAEWERWENIAKHGRPVWKCHKNESEDRDRSAPDTKNHKSWQPPANEFLDVDNKNQWESLDVERLKMEETCQQFQCGITFWKMSAKDAEKWLVGIQESDTCMRLLMSANKIREVTLFPEPDCKPRPMVDRPDQCNIEGGWENDGADATAPIDYSRRDGGHVVCGSSNLKGDDILSKLQQFCQQLAYNSKLPHQDIPSNDHNYEPSNEEESYESFLQATRCTRNCSEETVVIDSEDDKDKMLLFSDDQEEECDNKGWMALPVQTVYKLDEEKWGCNNNDWMTPMDFQF